MATRRAVIAGTGAVAAAIATSAASLAEISPVDDAVALRQITEVQAAHRRARATFETAAQAFKASIPAPHRSINFDNRDHALCGSWSYAKQSRFIDLKPTYLPTNQTLDNDLRACARHFPERYGRYCRLTRRLKARLKRREHLIKRAERRFRLEELEIACDAAERRFVEHADLMFEAPALTAATVCAQARMLVAFSAEIEPKSSAYYKAGRYGRQLAENLLALDRNGEA